MTQKDGISLMIVDMQRYYIEESSDYSRYFNMVYANSLEYIRQRCNEEVIPNIIKIKKLFSEAGLPVIFLRLCGKDTERRDLHRFFSESWRQGSERGFSNVYPLEADPMADIIPQLKPGRGDIVVNKTTFSPFSSSGIEEKLSELDVTTIVFAGLATSQCVETTARDASDRGYDVIHIYDAQADYDQTTHDASLYSSRGVCGGVVFETDSFIKWFKDSRGLT